MVFFLENIFLIILAQWRPPSVIHGWKATDLLFMIVKRKRKNFTLWSVRFSGTHQDRLSTWPETASYTSTSSPQELLSEVTMQKFMPRPVQHDLLRNVKWRKYDGYGASGDRVMYNVGRSRCLPSPLPISTAPPSLTSNHNCLPECSRIYSPKYILNSHISEICFADQDCSRKR